MLSKLFNQNAKNKYLCSITVLQQIRACFLLAYWTYLLALIPLPVYNFVQFTKILFFYAFDYTSLDLGVTVSWSH